jgi:hypothetical protein
MEDLSPLLAEIQTTIQEMDALQIQDTELRNAIDKTRDRRYLLEHTWRILCSNPGMTLIQAKMLAHDKEATKKRGMSFSWVDNRMDQREHWWLRILRSCYIGLGGK